MIKKTYVRVITLLLVALMILGVMAPAFTSYAADGLIANNNSPATVTLSGTPDGEKLSAGTYYFTVSGSDLKLYVSTSSSSIGTDTTITCKGSEPVTYGGLTFSKKSGE